MSEQTKQFSEEINPYLQEISDNLNTFIENINCLRETYEYSEQMLRMQRADADRQYEGFMKTLQKNPISGELDIPISHYREFLKKSKRKRRAERAVTLVPPTYLVSLVSLYDLFYAGIIRIIYRISPEKLKENNRAFMYRDLCDYKSVQEIKVLIIEDTIEDLLRESHIEQFSWLEKAMGVSTLKKFEEWPKFVEITERRNLFVHSDGIVSQQYINECRKYKSLQGDVKKGMQLVVDKPYFENAYRVLYIVGIKLSQMLAHTIYDKQYPNDTSSIDGIFINNVFELITDCIYDVAISVSEFVLNNPHFRHNANDRSYILLNLAQSYKWRGDKSKCLELLENEDSTAWKDELLIPKFVLEDKYSHAYEKMKAIGSGSKVLTADNYRQWPIFKEIRKEKEFIAIFKDIFKEELENHIAVKVEKEEEADSTTSASDIHTLNDK